MEGKEEQKRFTLSEEEKAAIEAQRKDMEMLDTFKQEYEALVKRTGFRWGVDMASPLNSIKLGIGKVGN